MVSPIDFMRRKLWWFDVVYPVALGMMLFGTLSYIVYGGRESSRLSLLAERFLLETTLSLAPLHELTHAGEIITVTGDVFEIDQKARVLGGSTPDDSMGTYQNIVKSLVGSGVKNIMIVWRSENHPHSEEYYRPLKSYLESIQKKANVFFITQIDETRGVKDYLGSVATVFDNLPCANTEQEEVQTYCPILPQSPDWIAQWMLENLFMKSRKLTETTTSKSSQSTGYWAKWGEVNPSWKTRYLPSTVEGYITYLVSPQQIPDYSFSNLLNQGGLPGAVPEFAFVGLDLTGSVAPSSRPSMPIAIKTPYQDRSLRKTSFKLDGVPLHQYWAMIGQTMLEGRLPNVASQVMVWSMNVAFAGVILFLMFRWGGAAASLAFMLWCLTAPVINVGLLAYLGFYLPVFNSYYVGLSILIMSGFARLSLTTLTRWRSEERSRSHLKAADLKGNFISLLSHNLNTPIAKMQGLIELLAFDKSVVSTDLSCAEYYICQIQLVIKAVLIATTLEEGAAKETPRNISFILEEFKGTYGPLMRQLGIQVVYHTVEASDEELLILPLAFDLRAITTALAAALALAGMGLRETLEVGSSDQTIGLFTRVREGEWKGDGDGEGPLQVEFGLAFAGGASSRVISWVEATEKSFHGFRGLVSTDFVRGVLAALVVLTTEYYGGSLGTRAEGDGVCLSFVPKT